MHIHLKNVFLKVTFNHLLTDGTNYSWFKVKSSSFSYTVKYWQNKNDFKYLKIYQRNSDGSCGSQIGYITRTGYDFSP